MTQNNFSSQQEELKANLTPLVVEEENENDSDNSSIHYMICSSPNENILRNIKANNQRKQEADTLSVSSPYFFTTQISNSPDNTSNLSFFPSNSPNSSSKNNTYSFCPSS